MSIYEGLSVLSHCITNKAARAVLKAVKLFFSFKQTRAIVEASVT